MIDGILPIDKPRGWTSHDVVARVRRLAGQRQVGHAGTLDPLASGLLLVVLGGATRLSAALMAAPKTYLAEVVLGVTTVTDDAEAPIHGQRPIEGVTQATIEAALARFHGEIEQQPPAYAAVKRNGSPLYRLARRGEAVEAAPRRVCVSALALERWAPPRARLRIECGAGTYIRAIARDLGVTLGVGGYLHALRRIQSGAIDVTSAWSLETLERQGIRGAVLPPDWAVATWPAVVVDVETAAAARHGRAFPVPRMAPRAVRVYSARGALVALARVERGMAHPYHVFRSPEDAGCH